MQEVIAGEPLIELIAIAYQARQPVLLHGRHGVGKSELLAEAAARPGIDLICRDLSLMEPPNLIGIPRAGEDGRTHYAAPAFLPDGGRGILLFEELNRAPRYMQAPCLQLLTVRRLNDYQLPPGWLPCAAINDAADGYFTDELDPALLSRFLNIRVVPDVGEWISWARRGGIHARVIDFVGNSPGVFADPNANPRAWYAASKFLTSWEQGDRRPERLAQGLAGLLGDKWALAFIQVYLGQDRPLQPVKILEAYPAHQAALHTWVKQRRNDVVATSLELLKRHLQPQRVYEAVVANAAHKANVEMFFGDLPPDLKRQVRAWLEERGFRNLVVSPKPKGGLP